MKNKNQFFAWVSFQRRPVSMQSYFGYNLEFIKTSIKDKWLKPFDYIAKGMQTSYSLLKNKPEILWIQLPPTPLLRIALAYKKINKKTVLIVDCHNGTFWGKWKKYLKKDNLNKCDVIIAHNSVIRDIAIELGVDRDKLMVLETKPAERKSTKEILPRVAGRPQVLMPCSFNIDEPVQVVFDAARQIPNIDILISGPNERGVSLFDYSKKPDNVKFLGYLSSEDYEITFRQSDVVMGLTTEDHIQLSVANEATGFEMPMVISDTKLLRDLFNKGAVYVETLNPKSIASGIIEALDKKDVLKKEVAILKKERIVRWELMASAVNDKIKNIMANKA
ncbi:glycosyltransferase [Pedobacter kyonggii]|uniref:Glycosyltransferase n=1 Tax=Pedobacter kyonggii TaxID=1926871 RepID=A0A4Q9HEX8_9SPHI|nr:glycosyltransferase [Pedobacter kyonggii]TBO43329.1 glycosyltransferase [Pedobacter kyonggii]